jgi:hypothetical protein
MLESGHPVPNVTRFLRGSGIIADRPDQLTQGSELGQQVG